MRKILLALIICVGAFASWGKAIDDAKALYADGQYEEAIEKLGTILKGAPKDGEANYYMGLCQIAIGNDAGALAPLQKAADKSIADAWTQLINLHLRAYDLDAADTAIEAWEKQLKKGRKQVPATLELLRSKSVTMSNMLERVEHIAIIDSIDVDSAQFFKHYRLSPGAGKLIPGDRMTRLPEAKDATVVYVPQNGKEMFWAMCDEDSVRSLVSAKVLDDGTIEQEAFMGDNLAQGGDSDFPFFTSDGMTFYYANNGENSIGGYDIFMSRRDLDGEVLDPQNVGMPYNSPYNDYMLVIDDEAGLGWFATDRNRIPGTITIYTFVPSETRVNYDPDDERIADYAKITSIKETQEGMDVNPNKLLGNALLQSATVGENPEETFILLMPSGKTYTKLSDFRNTQARNAMKQCLDREKALEQMKEKLVLLRQRYANGDKGVSEEILSLEQRIQAAQPMIVRLRNQAISQEK